MTMFKTEDIVDICGQFNIDCHDIGDCIDTTKNDNDQRYNYEINEKYFLKITNNRSVNDNYLSDIDLLIKNYESIGVYCPNLIKSKYDRFSYETWHGENKFVCYLEEKSIFPMSKSHEEVGYEFKKEVVHHLGVLASKFTNKNLSEVRSMWSLIELGPLDEDVDEKQENFDDLMTCLKEHNHIELMNRLLDLNDHCRSKIKAYMPRLPRCVYQGDLNNSNVLVDEHGKFKGIMDFNLSGTEVNINCFLNESMYFIKESDFTDLSAKELYMKMTGIQQELLEIITENYQLNKDELEVMGDYNKVIYTSFWPNTTLMIYMLNEKEQSHKVIDFLNMICES